jgi:hypothetical protein
MSSYSSKQPPALPTVLVGHEAGDSLLLIDL